MTNEKMLKIIYSQIKKYDFDMLLTAKAELENDIRLQCEKSKGKAKPFKSAMNIIKSADDRFNYSWKKDDIQWVTNSHIAIGFYPEYHMDLPEPEPHINPMDMKTIVESAQNLNTSQLTLPSLSELKSFIKIAKANKTPKDKMIFNFDNEKVSVNANYLLWILEAFQEPTCYIKPKSSVNPLYFSSPEGIAILCPVRRKDTW